MPKKSPPNNATAAAAEKSRLEREKDRLKEVALQLEKESADRKAAQQKKSDLQKVKSIKKVQPQPQASTPVPASSTSTTTPSEKTKQQSRKQEQRISTMSDAQIMERLRT